MNRSTVLLILALAGTAPIASRVRAEEPAPAKADMTTAQRTPTPVKPLLSRWVDLTEMSESQRYRNSYDGNGMRLFDNGQQRTALAGRIKLDPNEHYFVAVRATSGRFFNWAYADYAGHDFLYYATRTIAHLSPAAQAEFFAGLAADREHAGLTFHANGWKFFVRDLYGSATPIKQLTAELGSIPIERGYSSEITSFDDDGYIAGERIRIHDAAHLGIDEISFTNAYLGDLTTPNLFARGQRLGESNYRQVAAKKIINKRVAVSAEYNWVSKTDTLREAAVVKLPESKLVDDVHVELYQRLNTVNLQGKNFAGGNGFAVFASKKAGRVSGDFGYATVDPNYGVYINSRFLTDVGFSINGDTYGTGNRIFSHVSVKLSPVVTAFGFYTHVVSGNDYTYNKQGLNAGMKFDLKELVNTGRKVF